jgi:hypothetical protein
VAGIAVFPVSRRSIGAAAGHAARAVVDAAVERRRTRGFFAHAVFALEQGIVLQELFDLLIEFERRQLQEPDRLLQLRRER